MRIDGQARAARPDRSVLLSASAGSGKTRALVARLIHLLAAGAGPDELAAITFTEKAAAQMKDRLYRTLADAAWEDTRAAELLELAPADMPYPLVRTPEEIFSMLAARPDTLRASTIHALCLGLLRQFPLEAGLPPGFSVMDESEIPIRRDRVADECLKAIENGELADEFRTLADAGLDVAGIKALLVTALEKRCQLTRLATSGKDGPVDGSASRNAALSIIEEGRLARLAGEMAGLLRQYGLADDDTASAFEALSHLKGIEEFPDIFEGLKEYFYTKSLTLLARSPLTKSASEKAAGKAGAKELKERHDSIYEPIRELVSALAGLYDAFVADRALAAFLALYGKAEQLYAEMNHREGLVDYDDLEIYAYRLIIGPEAAKAMYRLEARTLHYLVDEFQDTGDIQWAILERLASEVFSGEGAEGVKAPTLFAVGDKKQSIYRFRQANYRLMDTLKAKMESSVARERRDFPGLDMNFRSAPEVVRAVNETFGALFKDEYNGAAAVRREARGGVRLRLADDEPGALAEEVAGALGCPLWDDGRREFRPASFGDMAVLIRSRTHLKDYERALMARGVPFKVVGGVGFFYQDEVIALISVLKYLENPDDKLSLAAALKSPLFGIPDSALALLYKEPDTALEKISPEAHSLFAKWRAMAGIVPMGSLVEAIITDSASRLAFGMAGGPAAVVNIEKLLGLAREQDGRGVVGLSEFTEWARSYREKAELATADVELPKYRDFVSIMTVHAAKGLEFPVVFLPGAARAASGRVDRLVVSDGLVAIKTDALLGENPRYASLKKTEQDEAAEEGKRLLYVAMTRARDRLVILGGTGKPAEGSWLRLLQEANPESLLGDDKKMDEKGGIKGAYKGETPCAPAGPGGPSPLKAGPSLPAKENLRPLPLQAGVAFISPSSLASMEYIGEKAGQDLAHALMVGKLVHLALESHGKGVRMDISRTSLREPGLAGLTDKERETIVKAAESMVSSLLADKDLSELIGPGEGKYFELPLLMKRDGAVVFGKADFVIVEGDSARVIDYKTGLAGRPKEEIFKAYLPQLTAYCEAVKEAYGLAEVKPYLLLVDTLELVGQ